MKTQNTELMSKAKESLSGKWGLAIGTNILFILVSAVSAVIPLGSILLSGALTLGMVIFSLNIYRNENAEISNIFEGFNDFVRSLVSLLLMVIFILLWMLLLIIPGVIKAFAYSQVFYIISENKEISAMDALKKSELMMKGFKLKYFGLSLLLGLLGLACILTAGIGFLWLIPYVNVCKAAFYDDVKTNFGEEDTFTLVQD